MSRFTFSSRTSDLITSNSASRQSQLSHKPIILLLPCVWSVSWTLILKYTSSVFCYDKHKKNFDIHFSMKRQAWRMSRLLRRLFWIPPCCVFKNGYFIAKTGQFWWSINIRIEFYLFVSHGGMKDRGSRCEFRKALRILRNLHVDPLSFIPPWETNK